MQFLLTCAVADVRPLILTSNRFVTTNKTRDPSEIFLLGLLTKNLNSEFSVQSSVKKAETTVVLLKSPG